MADENEGGVPPTGAPVDATADAPTDALGADADVEVPVLADDESSIGQPGEALQELLPALDRTGHEGVDDALATLDGLADTPVDEHVAVFDAVHEELRRTLDQAPDPDPDSGPELDQPLG